MNYLMLVLKHGKVFWMVNIKLDYTILANKDLKYQDVLNILDEFKIS